MGYTKDFKTRSEFKAKKNLDCNRVFPIALDIGYSGVKGMSPYSYYCFPSFVRKNTGDLIGNPKATDILYRDETGTYAVGSMALDSLVANDTNDSMNTLFGRNRYFSQSFLILARVGLALGMRDHGAGHYQGEKPIFLQTGLPPAYRKTDTPLLVEALQGEHRFEVKVGNSSWFSYNIELPAENISVIDQPIGSVYSASKRNDGSTVTTDDGMSYIDKHVLVVDGGFGTMDVFSITGRSIDSFESFNDCSMKVVFERTVNDIRTQMGTEVQVHTLQNYLEDGAVTTFDRRAHASKMADFTEILKKNAKAVCNLAMDKIENAYNGLIDYDYLLVTGGTGAAWLSWIKERYKDMNTLKIIAGNQNDASLPHIYSNVRGYYIFRVVVENGRKK